MSEKSARLDSLDALRGFDMFFITGGSALLAALGTLATGNADCALAVQMRHVAWEGLHVFDLIFPLFLFITGVTFPFSTAKRLARGETKGAIVKNIIRRALTLVILGALYECIQDLDWPHFRVWSVIGRIGIVWAAAALLSLYASRRVCILVCLANLIGWWLFLSFFPAPDANGAHPIATEAGCLAAWIDAHYLTTAHRFEGGLATLAMLPTALFGIWAGEGLRFSRPQLTEGHKVATMIGIGLAAILVGVVWSLPTWGCPIVKNIWSGSYALVAGGISVILLAAFHWIIDVRGWTRWAFYFRVIGVNAIAIYFLARFVPFQSIGLYFLGAAKTACTAPGWSQTVAAVGRCAAGWLLLYFLYRKKIFFKV